MKNKTLIFFLDAVRPDYIGRNTPFMNSLKKSGSFLKLDTLLGYSSGIWPSIWTSTYQDQHNKFLVYQYDPAGSKFKWFSWFKFMPAKLRQYFFAGLKVPYYFMPKIRKYLPKIYHERLLDLPPTINPTLAKYFSVDKSSYSGYNLMKDIEKKYSIDYTGDHINLPTFKKAAPVEEWKLSNNDIDFFFTYDTDGFGHTYGPKSKEIKDLMNRIDKSIKRLYREADKKYDDVNLFIFSDHGMCEVNKFLDVQQELIKLPYKMPEDYLAFFDASMVRFWVKDKKVRKEIIKLIKSVPELTYLSESLRDKYGLNFKDRRFGDLMCIVEPETRIFPDYFAPVKSAIKGLHGYDPNFEHSKGVWLSNHKSKRKKMHIIDIIPSIADKLKVKLSKKVQGKTIY